MAKATVANLAFIVPSGADCPLSCVLLQNFCVVKVSGWAYVRVPACVVCIIKQSEGRASTQSDVR